MLIPLILSGQVTIGSPEKPNAGALLDLKENSSGISSRGLGLPRVKLEELKSLKPTVPTHVTNTIDNEHVGLLVYHVSGESIPECAVIPDGIYVWSGTEWQGLGTKKNKLGLESSSDYIDLPSGLDARGTSSSASINLSWLPTISDLAFTMEDVTPDVSTTNYKQLLGGVIFNPALVSPMSGLGGSTNFTMQADPIESTPTDWYPWKTRQTTIKFKVRNDECNTEALKEVTVNQTNYVISYNRLGYGYVEYRLQDQAATRISEYIRSNVYWKLKEIDDPKDILTPGDKGPFITSGGQPLAKTEGGGFRKDGGQFITFSELYFNLNPAYVGERYEIAKITFEQDLSKEPVGKLLANPLIIRAITCRGNIDLSGLTSATPTQTSNPASNWGANIVLHDAKPGVYEQFLSADFGAAGRWMTSNLSAKAYDGATHDGGRNLEGPRVNINDLNTAYWCYPSKNNGDATDPTISYDNNPLLGYLYTWDAATAGKGEATGYGNADTGKTGSDGTSYVAERRFTEAVGSYTGPADNNDPGKYPVALKQAKRRQGICPQGWHLPSEWEWLELQEELIKNTSKYSSLDDIDNGSGTILASFLTDVKKSPGESSPIVYGSPDMVGAAMRDICEPGYSFSNQPKKGGFSAFYAGFIINGQNNSFDHASPNNLQTRFWSTTTQSYAGIVTVQLHKLGDPGHSRLSTTNVYGRSNMMSVRCKRDQ